MQKDNFDISPIKNAGTALSNALAFALKIELKNDDEREFYEFETCRASVIQHFETSYELCWKFIKRWLEEMNGDDVDGITKKNLYRLASENNLISDVEKWLFFMYARNKTSHVYDEDVAEEVYAAAKEFKFHMNELISRLEAGG